ncbi:hypothetical protein HPB48_006041 [Haemaphysalis longicornis]|uniref:Uncharacterized protein n=1 Tax=Haemaphysalis longicornis TaxID=44386 RepID=A0A9J6FKU5_HAELO|nr:hypothetical protein HPB48_006041 [Haemaphysalis longicornis]
MMPATEYTLTGFGEFLERRRVVFHRAAALPSGLCCCVRNSGVALASANLRPRAVRCLPGRDDSDLPFGRTFAGKMCELNEHLARCVSDEVECSKCGQVVVRGKAVQHQRECDGDPSRRLIGDTDGRCIAEGLVNVRTDIETLRELVTSQGHTDSVVNEANALVERIKRLELQLLQPDVGGRESDTDAGLNRPWPFRRATKPRNHVAVCSFGEMYGALDSLKEKKEAVITGRVVTLAGYTFQVDCCLENDKNEGWPFTKLVTLVVTHLRDETRDIRLVLRPEVDAYVLALRKPIPKQFNAGIRSENVLWVFLETAGFIDNDSLYLNVEFE